MYSDVNKENQKILNLDYQCFITTGKKSILLEYNQLSHTKNAELF